MLRRAQQQQWLKWGALALTAGAVVAAVLLVPDSAWAEGLGDLGESKIRGFEAGLKKISTIAIGLAGLLAGVYIAFGRQDGNERLGAVVKGAIVVSCVVSAVTYLAG
jgi:hypothetical protein